MEQELLVPDSCTGVVYAPLHCATSLLMLPQSSCMPLSREAAQLSTSYQPAIVMKRFLISVSSLSPIPQPLAVVNIFQGTPAFHSISLSHKNKYCYFFRINLKVLKMQFINTIIFKKTCDSLKYIHT